MKNFLFSSFFFLSTITNFLDKIKLEIEKQCPFNLRQVDAFLENYSCSNQSKTMILSSEISYINEDDDLKFINTNTNPLNNSEQNVYIVWKRIFLYYEIDFCI